MSKLERLQFNQAVSRERNTAPQSIMRIRFLILAAVLTACSSPEIKTNESPVKPVRIETSNHVVVPSFNIGDTIKIITPDGSRRGLVQQGKIVAKSDDGEKLFVEAKCYDLDKCLDKESSTWKTTIYVVGLTEARFINENRDHIGKYGEIKPLKIERVADYELFSHLWPEGLNNEV